MPCAILGGSRATALISIMPYCPSGARSHDRQTLGRTPSWPGTPTSSDGGCGSGDGKGSATGTFADAAPLSRKPHFPAVKSLVFADRLLLEVSLGDTTAMRFWLVA